MATILAVHAHPDDIEHLAAGALAILAAKGHAIRIATLTAGECGSAVDRPRRDRRASARPRRRAPAALIGAEYRCADLPDLGVFNDDASRRAVTELIRWAAPDLVLAASPADYHPDHEAASQLTRDACFAVLRAQLPHRRRPRRWRRSRTSISWTRSAAAIARAAGSSPTSGSISPAASR